MIRNPLPERLFPLFPPELLLLLAKTTSFEIRSIENVPELSHIHGTAHRAKVPKGANCT